jgi:protein-tyrosine phosphatase
MKILMVCLGNICRSPMAEGLMRLKIEKYKIDAEVDSAGFESFHTGDSPDFRAVRVMKNHGIDITTHRARQFRRTDFETFDHIFVMDSGNYNDVKSVTNDKDYLLKVDYILNILKPGSNQPVPDPYYGGESGFEKTYLLLDEATDMIAFKLKNGGING